MMVVTRAQVAQLAGVSPSLVSYVTNDGPRSVSPQARARIEEAIEELGYTPNVVAQALRGSGTRTIGLLIPTAVNPFFGELSTAIEKELFDSGNTLAVGITNDDLDRELRYLKTLLARQVDGIMVISSHSRATLDKLASADTPSMVIDRLPEEINVSTVAVDNQHGAMTAVAHLHDHGHEVVGCIGGRAGTASADARVEAWRMQQGAAGFETSDSLVTRTDFTEQSGYDGAMALLGSSPGRGHGASKPTGLFVSSDIQATGVLLACHELGLSVPGDIAIVSFDGTEAGAFSVPPLTSYRQPVEELARLAVSGLLERIEEPSLPPLHEVPRGSLRIGRSCGEHATGRGGVAHAGG